MLRLLFRLTMGIKTALPKIELYMYTAVVSLALLWAGSWIIEASSGTLYFYLLLFLASLRSQNYSHVYYGCPRTPRVKVHFLLFTVNQSTIDIVLLFVCWQTVLLIDVHAGTGAMSCPNLFKDHILIMSTFQYINRNISLDWGLNFPVLH